MIIYFLTISMSCLDCSMTCVHPWQMDKSSKCFQGQQGGSGGNGDNGNGNNKPCNNGTSPESGTTSAPPEQKPSSKPTTTTTTTTTTTATPETTTTAASTTTQQSEQTTEQSTEPSAGGCGNETIKCTKEGFHGHPTDCTKFYRCVDFHQNGKDFTIFHFDCAVCLTCLYYEMNEMLLLG
jgi:hypothetical protein